MKDYARIAAKIRETPWLITESGLDLILSIMDARMNGVKLTDEEIAIRLEQVGTHGSDVGEYQVTNGVGILPIYGPIFGKANLMTEMSGATSLEAFRADFAAMLADPSVSSIILDIDSPGGTSEMVSTTGDEIYAAREVKPVVAFANTMAGSAAYWLGSQAEKFYTSPDGIVGSVGAYTVHEDQSVKDAQQGIKYTFISAGPYKTEGNQHLPLSREGEDYRQEMINELYSEFVGAISRGRGVSTDKVIADYGGGRMINANKAIIAGMVDAKMEFNDLVAQQMESTPQRVSIYMDGRTIAAVVKNGTIHLDSNTDMEHSEPGTGTPPTPKPREDTDRAIASGSRRGDIPDKFPEITPGSPKASSINGGMMELSAEAIEQLMKLFKVDSEEALVTAITSMHAESSALRADTSLASQERDFASKYPDMWEQIKEDRKINRENAAQKFVESNQMFKRMDGDKLAPTQYGLSALAGDTINEVYLKFAENSVTMADFEKCISVITQGGMVEYGEKGSNQEKDLPEFSTDTAAGIANARRLFAAKVAEVQAEDKLDYKSALTEAGKRYPDLAAAYNAAANLVT